MKKESIVQFVGFITRLDFEEFVTKWDYYARQFSTDPCTMILQQGVETNKYKYISQQECPEENFKFAFMKGRSSEHFAEHKVKVVQAGGYLRVQTVKCLHVEKDHAKIMAFIDHQQTDIGFYRQLSQYSCLNIYQAYYESCAYGHILEFFAPEANAASLLQQLKTRTGTEAALYRECLVPSI